MRKIVLSTVSIFISFALFGCNKEKENIDEVNKPPKQEIVEEPIEEKVEEPVVIYSPLQGLPVKKVSNQRPVAVMVNNFHQARPQSGLSNADIVYEILAEGDITRFLAIFQSNIPEKIGPVRSARDYYINLANGYHAIFISHGHSPKAKQMMESGVIDSLNGLYYDGTLFKRDPNRYAPHNSYVTKDGIKEGALIKKYKFKEDVKALLFSQEQAFDSTWKKISNASIFYSNDARNNVTYKYDDDTTSFSRIQNGVIAKDALNDKQLAIKNILIVEAEHQVLDSYGRRFVNINGSGKGYYLTEGMKKEIKWKNVGGRIIPFDEAEKEIPLLPGQTWINFVPNFSSVTIK